MGARGSSLGPHVSGSIAKGGGAGRGHESGSDASGSHMGCSDAGGDNESGNASAREAQGGNVDRCGAQRSDASCSRGEGRNAGQGSTERSDAGSSDWDSGRGGGGAERSEACGRAAQGGDAGCSGAGSSGACCEPVKADMALSGAYLHKAGAPLSTGGQTDCVGGQELRLWPGSNSLGSQSMRSSCSVPAAPSAAAGAGLGGAQGAAADCMIAEAGKRVLYGNAEPAWLRCANPALAGAMQRAENDSRAAVQHEPAFPLLPAGTSALPLPPVRALVPYGVGWSDSESDSDGEHDARLEAKYGLCPKPDSDGRSLPACSSGRPWCRSFSSDADAGSLQSGGHARRPTQSTSSGSSSDSNCGGSMGHSEPLCGRQSAGRRELQPWLASRNGSDGAQPPADSKEGGLRVARRARCIRRRKQGLGKLWHGSAAEISESRSSQGAFTSVARPALAEPDLHGELALLGAALGRGAAALSLGDKSPEQSAAGTAAGAGRGAAAPRLGDDNRGLSCLEAAAACDATICGSGSATADGALLPKLSKESRAYLMRHGLLPGGA